MLLLMSSKKVAYHFNSCHSDMEKTLKNMGTAIIGTNSLFYKIQKDMKLSFNRMRGRLPLVYPSLCLKISRYKGLGDKRILVLPLNRTSHNPLQIAKMLLRNLLILTPEMILKLNSISIEGSEPSFGRQENTSPDVIVQKVSITPEKFRNDVDALVGYIGEEHFISGLSIEVTLSELLAVVPKKRRRTEAYNALVKYLREERNILLTIKSNKKNGKDL